ncbi:MAG: DASS family sodium-coupled anion symporter [Bilophila sp.]
MFDKRTAWSKGLKWLVCILTAALLYFVITPVGLSSASWLYVSLVAAIVLGLILEPAPPAVVALTGLLTAGLLRLGPPGSFEPSAGLLGNVSLSEAVRWVLSGFSSPLLWTMLSVFMIGMGFEKTGLAHRIAVRLVRTLGKTTLGLGYAVALADGFLAPFIPSGTARSGGIVYPLVMGIPPLFNSSPEEEPRKIGAYLVWVGFASSCVTSSLFLTALFANLLALDSLRAAHLPVPDWSDWFLSVAPAGIVLLLLTPLLTYWLYPPTLKQPGETLSHATSTLSASLSVRQWGMILVTVLAVILWSSGLFPDFGEVLVALLTVCLMVVFGVVRWEDVVGNNRAWSAFFWLGSMITLSKGLQNVTFFEWCLAGSTQWMHGLTPNMLMLGMVMLFAVGRYVMAGATLQTVLLLPLFLTAAAGLEGVTPDQLATLGLVLALSTGLMGVVTPYATGQGPVWFASGYIKTGEFWFLGLVFGTIHLAALLLVFPWISLCGLLSHG